MSPFVVTPSPAGPPGSTVHGKDRTAPDRLTKTGCLRRRVPLAPVAEFSRALALLVSARVPLADSVETAAAQSRDRRVSTAGAEAARALRTGVPLADALGAAPRVFDPFLVHLVRAGEMSGNLGPLLLRAASHLEKSAALRRKFLLALTYPALVVAVAFLSVVFLLTVIVPTFADIFSSFGHELPGPTRFVLWASGLVRENALLILLVVSVSTGAAFRVLRVGVVRDRLDALILRLPFAGAFFAKVFLSQLCRTTSTLLSSGIGLVPSLEMAGDALRNTQLRKDVKALKDAVVSGRPLAEAARASRHFPRLVVQLFAVGEETAELDIVLLHLADHYDQEIDDSVNVIMTVMEPVMIIVIGAVLGFILVALYLPMFDLAGAIR